MHKAFLDKDSELKFEFFLATELKMTVARLRAEMPQEEFIRWSVYYGLRSQEAEMAAQFAAMGKR
jgi:hypothetical protein